jgi:hypothetical protein
MQCHTLLGLLGVRPWFPGDTYATLLALALLALLVIYQRGRSPVAIGALVGTFLGCQAALIWGEEHGAWGKRYSDVADMILLGCLSDGLAGLVCGAILRAMRRKATPAKAPSTRIATCDKGLWYWATAFFVSGVAIWLGMGGFLVYSYEAWIEVAAVCGLGAAVIGVTVSRLGPAHRRLLVAAELFVVLALTAGTGGIIGWRIVLPELNEIFTQFRWPGEERLFAMQVTYMTAAVGGLIGGVTWAMFTLKKRRAASSEQVSAG